LAQGGEVFGPGDHLGVLLEQRPALAFGQAAPNAELHLIVERVGEALGPDGTLPANTGRLPLRRPANKQILGVAGPTERLRDPLDAGFCGGGFEPPADVRVDCTHVLRTSVNVGPSKLLPALAGPGNDYSGAARRRLSSEQAVWGMNRTSPDWGNG